MVQFLSAHRVYSQKQMFCFELSLAGSIEDVERADSHSDTFMSLQGIANVGKRDVYWGAEVNARRSYIFSIPFKGRRQHALCILSHLSLCRIIEAPTTVVMRLQYTIKTITVTSSSPERHALSPAENHVLRLPFPSYPLPTPTTTLSPTHIPWYLFNFQTTSQLSLSYQQTVSISTYTLDLHSL